MAVFVMLTGAAIGAQIGTVATKYAKGLWHPDRLRDLPSSPAWCPSS